jgi:ankyrin repeat protein
MAKSMLGIRKQWLTISGFMLAAYIGNAISATSLEKNTNAQRTGSGLQGTGWIPTTRAGTPFWLAQNALRTYGLAQRCVFLYLEHEFFSQDRLLAIFRSLSDENETPMYLTITAFSDKAALLRAIEIERPPGTDVQSTARLSEPSRQHSPPEKGFYRAYFVRAPDGAEYFRYSPDPDNLELKLVDIRKSLAEASEPQLVQAVMDGDLGAVSGLIARGVNVNLKNNEGCPSILLAPRRNANETVKLLVRAGADVNARNPLGETPLMAAAHAGALDLVTLLLDHGAEVNATDKVGNTPLLNSINSRDLAVIRLLLDRGAELDARDARGRTALMRSCFFGRSAAVGLLVERGANIEAADVEGRTPLIDAAMSGDATIVKLLLDHGANPNDRTREGKTALILTNQAPEIVDLLVDYGADVNAKDKGGWTALMQTALSGHTIKAQALLKHGADLNVRDGEGRTALSIARKSMASKDGVRPLLEGRVHQ